MIVIILIALSFLLLLWGIVTYNGWSPRAAAAPSLIKRIILKGNH